MSRTRILPPGGISTRMVLAGIGAGLLALLAFGSPSLVSAESARAVPPLALPDMPVSGAATEIATFAGGCFWGVQGVFQHVDGVKNAVSGYAGGARETAQYEMIGRGDTGHAEAVQITYDPRKISYARLMQIFFSVAHDPTELNRQGPDVGTQYRSAVFPADADQARVAAAYIAQLDQAGIFKKPIATKIEPGQAFYVAEAYHQDFMTKNPTYPYIVVHDLPKVKNLNRIFPEVFRTAPMLVADAAKVR